MLVLNRTVDQKILIGDDVTITITRIGRNFVRVGIEAPHDVLIRREELVAQWTSGSEACDRYNGGVPV